MVSRNSVRFRRALAGVGWRLSLSVTCPNQFRLLLMAPRFPCDAMCTLTTCTVCRNHSMPISCLALSMQ